MEEVYLSLYVMRRGAGRGGALLSFLVLAEDEDEAESLSEEFVAEVAVLANLTASRALQEEARVRIAALRKQVCLLQDPAETQIVVDAVREQNPGIAEELAGYVGDTANVLTVEVRADSGFREEDARILRRRMARHRVLNSLSVALQ